MAESFTTAAVNDTYNLERHSVKPIPLPRPLTLQNCYY